MKFRPQEILPKQYGVGLRDARRRMVAFVQGTSTGEVTFQAVKPGMYAIVVAAPEKTLAVTRTISTAGETQGSEVNAASAPALELTADLIGGGARIEGIVEKNGHPTAGVMVALVPNDPEHHIELFRRDQSDFDGTFLLLGVIPGSYTIVAVEDAWGFAWLKPGVLARYVQHGQNVIITGKMTGTFRLPNALQVQAR